MEKKFWGRTAIEKGRALLMDFSYIGRHRVRQTDFTRRRLLTFETVMLLLLQKTLKSVQLHLQEFFGALQGSVVARAVTPSAWTQARAKLHHTAFVELNEVAVLETVYEEDQGSGATRWHGHRLLAVDGSVLRLPDSDALWERFGGQDGGGYKQTQWEERMPHARLSVLYDCLNRIVVDTRVGAYKQGEREQLLEHLGAMRSGDVLLLDRGYASYLLLAHFAAQGIDFIVRCNRQCFLDASKLFEADQAGVSVTTVLPAKTRRAEARAAGLPLELKVRFVSVRLPGGALEVLVTSLLDESTHPAQSFLETYHQRWGVETFYGLIKGRLDLENFSGHSVEAVLQDIHATMFLTNLETLLTADAQASLSQPDPETAGRRQHPKKINRAISFHALKGRIIDLLASQQPIEEVLDELTEIFQANAVAVRTERSRPREFPSDKRVVHFLKRLRKIVF